jgi:XRE family aerobic/anaerobic benzoate catabolism transcriptional regulator
MRRELKLTRDQLAERSGLSARFLARVEAGSGNISVLRLESLAAALGSTAEAMLRPGRERNGVVTLVGMRGAGKSTVGPILASVLGIPFVEIDTRILDACGLPLDQLFELHGERYYRRLEREAVRQVVTGASPVVLAAAGGVVHEPATWDLLLQRTTVVWLRARPEDHWKRVVAQGDRRPMADNPAAMEELRAMLRGREETYSRSTFTVDTSGRSPREVAATIEEGLLSLDEPESG